MNAHAVFSVIGMKCAGCAGSVEKGALALAGVVSARADLPGASLAVEYLPNQVGPEAIVRKLASLGFQASPR